MNDWGYVWAVLVLAGLVTFFERALPFLAGSWLQRMPWVRKLGLFLAPAIMVLLTLATALGAAKGHPGLPLPELFAVMATMVMELLTRKPILSIFVGTALYIVFRMGVFPGLT